MKRVLSIILVFALATAVLAGCGNNSSGSGPGGLDTSKAAELIVYNFGEPHLDAQVVVDALNVKLKEDINATFSWNWIPWTDYQQTYSLLLAAGEPIDITYTATWTPFLDHAQRGAFLALNDLLPVNAPDIYALFTEMDWLECSWEGNIYAIPSYYPMVLPNGVVYRDDLRQKYNLSPINSMATLEAYLQAVADNEPDLIPYHAATTLDVNPIDFFWLEYSFAEATTATNTFIAYPASPGQEHMRDIFNYIESPEFEQFCIKMRDWYERGFWSRNVLTNNVTAMDAMVNGRSAMAIAHVERLIGDVANPMRVDHPEWEPTAWLFSDNMGYVFRAATMQDATAIPRTSSNPERALAALNLLMTDQAYFDLGFYGIEGVHHVFNDDGSVSRAPGVDPQNEAYGVHGLNQWNMRNRNIIREFFDPDPWVEGVEMKERSFGYSIGNKLNAFQFNLESIEAELAAIAQLDAQYRVPLLWGAADISTLEEYRQQLRNAGSEKVMEELKRQITEFADAHGY